MRVLVVNAGSSSLKLRLLDHGEVVQTADIDSADGHVEPGVLGAAIADWREIAAVGHRIVHGGTQFTGPVRIDPRVRSALADLCDLAPLHQPKALAALDATSEVLGDIPAVACFDTAFHASLPAKASTYAVPSEWRTRFGIRRYGFHGLSHAYIARRAPELVGAAPDALRIVSCHLGAGASLAAIAAGRSVDTTMGFTPLEGLVMATRSGSVDPGLVLWLETHLHLAAEEIAETLESRSGLLGLSGSADMRDVVAAARRGEEAASLALEVYLHRLCGSIAAMTAALGGLDVLAFTGGVGEHQPEIRARVASSLSFLGVGIDPRTNAGEGGDRVLTSAAAPVETLLIVAREDLEIAREVETVLA
jgi:acetate kinase